jgi:hypothetical protein
MHLPIALKPPVTCEPARLPLDNATKSLGGDRRRRAYDGLRSRMLEGVSNFLSRFFSPRWMKPPVVANRPQKFVFVYLSLAKLPQQTGDIEPLVEIATVGVDVRSSTAARDVAQSTNLLFCDIVPIAAADRLTLASLDLVVEPADLGDDLIVRLLGCASGPLFQQSCVSLFEEPLEAVDRLVVERPLGPSEFGMLLLEWP